MSIKKFTFSVIKNYFMPLYYYFLFIIILSLILFFIYSLFKSRKDIPAKLFYEALRNENSGHFEEAIVTYECALDEAKKRKFHNSLKNKIVEKLKVLHTTIEYKNSFHLISR